MEQLNPIFNHSGNSGDLLYSLHFIIELLECLKARTCDYTFNIQINQPAEYVGTHPYGNVMMTQASAEFMKPLIETLRFKKVTISETLPEACANISMFRKMKLNFTSGDLRYHYYELTKLHLPQDFSRNLFNYLPSNIIPELNDKILLIHTSRYNNYFLNLKELRLFQDKLLFIGLKSEHDSFQKEFFELDYLPCDDELDLALKMKSACGVIGNQSGLYALAEMLKIPRILFTSEFNKIQGILTIGPVNVNPMGGYFDTVRTQAKLIPAMENLFNHKEN